MRATKNSQGIVSDLRKELHPGRCLASECEKVPIQLTVTDLPRFLARFPLQGYPPNSTRDRIVRRCRSSRHLYACNSKERQNYFWHEPLGRVSDRERCS